MDELNSQELQEGVNEHPTFEDHGQNRRMTRRVTCGVVFFGKAFGGHCLG